MSSIPRERMKKIKENRLIKSRHLASICVCMRQDFYLDILLLFIFIVIIIIIKISLHRQTILQSIFMLSKGKKTNAYTNTISMMITLSLTPRFVLASKYASFCNAIKCSKGAVVQSVAFYSLYTFIILLKIMENST